MHNVPPAACCTQAHAVRDLQLRRRCPLHSSATPFPAIPVLRPFAKFGGCGRMPHHLARGPGHLLRNAIHPPNSVRRSNIWSSRSPMPYPIWILVHYPILPAPTAPRIISMTRPARSSNRRHYTSSSHSPPSRRPRRKSASAESESGSFN
ncbi:hypothetical protein EJ06DRAFT_35009 [Trichodelitschia bisporula]|uniref:Uncharacterized protein n=1 Tax=Trichodelitschia bisporula TaxID=703511 RepID=A0A6G1HUQ1_9PEZI|nr:hypothetical protein EJ06DRAFT_35009 [Trichodelitschia bisporula]